MKARRFCLALALVAALPAFTAQQAAAQRPMVWRVGGSSGWLGFSYSPARSELGRVIVVDTVVPESPAAHAGLQKADTILDVNGLRATSQLMASLGLEPGDRVNLNVRRNGTDRAYEITAAERPEGFRPMSNVFSFRTDSVMGAIRGALDSVRVHLDDLEMPRMYFNYADGDSATRVIIIGRGEDVDTIRIDTDSINGAFHFFADSLRSAFDSTVFRIAGPRMHFEFDGDSIFMPDSVRIRRMWPGAWQAWTDDDFEVHNLPFRSFTRVGLSAVAGMTLEELNPELGSYFGADRGLLVLDVGADTPAAKAGLRGGDVILRCAGNGVDSIRELRRAIARVDDDHVELVVLRERREIEMELAIER